MGRLTELFAFINKEKAPTEGEMHVRYSHITKNKELMDNRKAYRKALKQEALITEIDK